MLKKANDNFLTLKRQPARFRAIGQRLKDYKEVRILRGWKGSREQASRCMDCGIPFCHWTCPLGNYIPEWNTLVFQGKWKQACNLLERTNNLPEVTARVCPAICEFGCVLGINDEAVTIRENELAVIEYGFKQGVIRPRPPQVRTGKKVGIIGSGPAGLAAAAQLNRAGHSVVVFEKDRCIGGILRYGIPDFKLEKWILDRRIALWKKEGIIFKVNHFIGKKQPASALARDFDALLLAIGSQQPRDLNLPGRELTGIHLAMDFLIQSNKRVSGENNGSKPPIDVKGKEVVVIGGGDTGSDCVGVANRQGATRVTQIEILPQPPQERPLSCPWPNYPHLFKVSTSHEEGCERIWSAATLAFSGEKGKVKRISCAKVEFTDEPASLASLRRIPGSEFKVKADVVILALGFSGPTDSDIIQELTIERDCRGNIKTNPEFKTSWSTAFAAGDSRNGQSLVARALSDGRQAAYCIDCFLQGESSLAKF